MEFEGTLKTGLLRSGDQESALGIYQKALELNPNSKSFNAMLKKLNK